MATSQDAITSTSNFDLPAEVMSLVSDVQDQVENQCNVDSTSDLPDLDHHDKIFSDSQKLRFHASSSSPNLTSGMNRQVPDTTAHFTPTTAISISDSSDQGILLILDIL